MKRPKKEPTHIVSISALVMSPLLQATNRPFSVMEVEHLQTVSL